MTDDWRKDDARRQIIRLCHAGLDPRSFRGEVTAQLRRAVPFDAWCWPTADPATGLVTGADGRDIPPGQTRRFFEIEYTEPDFTKFGELARGPAHAGALSDATGGDLQRSPRYREIFGPAGIGEDLRVALLVDGACWGYLALHRDPQAPFRHAETSYVDGLSAHLAEGLRTSLLLGAVEAADDSGPGIVLVNEDLTIASLSPGAERLLADLPSKEAHRPDALPDAVLAVVIELLRLERNEAGAEGVPRARVAGRSGRWLVVHATRLSGGADSGQIGVVLESARAHELMPLLLAAYALTGRESQITQLVLLGHPTREIATALGISPHTVQQHLKGVFEKVGVHSKRELAARIWVQQYWPRMAAGAELAADGSFRDAALPREL